MYKHLLITSIFFIISFIFLNIFTPEVKASHKIMEENFNSYSDGDFISNTDWIQFNDWFQNPCTANWKIKNGMIGVKIENEGSCTTNLKPSDSKWNNLGENYIVEFDIKLVNGTDHNFVYRYIENFGFYEIHFQSPGDLALSAPEGIFITNIVKNYPNRETPYHIKIILNKRNVQVYVDNELVKDYHSFSDFPSGRIALRASTGADRNSETYFDNIVVTSIDNEPNLDVPLLKQTSEPWQSMEYDSAHKWSPASPTIYSWGCALTSAAMILQYYGIDKTPYGTRLDPGTLNNWLISQPDGYIGNGLVNWLAISRFSRLAKESGNNPNFFFDALEYDRNAGGNKRQQLVDDLNDDRPGILEVPGHFVVAKGIEGNTFLINDPFYNRQRLSDGYHNTFISVGRYIPSNTDLSYIMAVNDQNLHIKLKDTLGNILSESFSQLPLENETNSAAKSDNPLKIIYLKKPSSGIYYMELTSDATQKDVVDFYLYSSSGNVATSRHQILISKNNPEIITLKFDKDNENKSEVKKVISFPSVIADINESISLKQLNKILGNQLKRILLNAEKDLRSDQKISAQMKLETAILLLKVNKGVLIKQSVFDILMQDFTYLKSSL